MKNRGQDCAEINTYCLKEQLECPEDQLEQIRDEIHSAHLLVPRAGCGEPCFFM